ncbi:MAG: tetratricopeptide repeat protein [Vicinamibacteria bacterium]
MKRLLFVLSALALSTPLVAQDWKGQGRLMGKVNDDTGKGLPGATVTFACPTAGNGGTSVVTDKKGQWSYTGFTACNWNLDIKAEGFQVRTLTVPLGSEQLRLLPIDVKLEKLKGPPPELVNALKAGDDAFKTEQWEAARTNYLKVSELRPDLGVQLYPRLARIYAAEKNTEKAIEYLQKSVDSDPSNQQLKIVAANAAMEAGMTDKALAFLATVDDAGLQNGDGYYDIAISFLRKSDSANAVAFFTKALAKDPKIVDAYYWRGISYVQQGKLAEAKVDMQKVVELDPTGPNGVKAKKALEGLK